MDLLPPPPETAILVTGATGAIGGEIARQALRTGATVGVHGSRPETVAAAIKRLRAIAPDARLIAAPGDFREPGAIEAVVARVAEAAGRLDAVVHCAITGAPGVTGPLAKTDPDRYAELAGAVLASVQRLAFAALPHLAQGGGTFVTFAADSGRFAAPRQALLGAAYGGIMSFVRNWAREAARDGVRVHCLSPSFVAETPIYDAFVARGGRADAAAAGAGLGLPTPADIAPIALFLCGPGARRITGQVISINGGLNA